MPKKEAAAELPTEEIEEEEITEEAPTEEELKVSKEINFAACIAKILQTNKKQVL